MTTRCTLLCFVAILIGILGLSAIYYGNSASADSIVPSDMKSTIPPPPPEARTPRPSDGIADPVTDPVGAIQDARETWPEGWAVFVLLGVVAISRGLGTARGRWPESAALRWMTGRAAFVVGGAGLIAAAAFDALILGGSWLSAGYAAAGAVLLLISPEPKEVR